MKTINAGSATADYMAYQFKYDTIHGKYGGTVETDGDFLVINGQKVPTTRCRDPSEAGWGKVRACEGGVRSSERRGSGARRSGAKRRSAADAAHSRLVASLLPALC